MATTDAPPLAPYRYVGWYEDRTATGQPAGDCWHCGQGIAYVVVARHTVTGEQVTVGTTCAERIGLDTTELKAMLAEKYEAERAEQSAAARREHAERSAREEAERAARHGEHGTVSRYLAGCRPWGMCRDCYAAAPHGTDDRFRGAGDDTPCRCVECVDWALTEAPARWEVRDLVRLVVLGDGLVGLRPGDVVSDARPVRTRYGLRWRVDATDAWLPYQPARRGTLAKRGFVEAVVPVLVERFAGGEWRADTVLGSPVVDRWGEPIPHE